MLQPRVISVLPLPDYRLLVEYATGERKIFDVKPYISGDWYGESYISGDWYGELEDLDTFNTVRPCGTTVKWKGGQDIAPDELYCNSVPFNKTAKQQSSKRS